jgi:hypothetical protein
LLNGKSDLVIFRTYGDLSKAKKIPKPAEEFLERFHQRFLDSLDDMLDLTECGDCSSAQDTINDVESAANGLGLDISQDIALARENAEEIGEPDYDPADEEERPDRGPIGGDEMLTDDDIDQIFSALDKA